MLDGTNTGGNIINETESNNLLASRPTIEGETRGGRYLPENFALKDLN